MSQTRNLRSQSLDLLRFPLACIIVLIHVFSTTGLLGINMLNFHFFVVSKAFIVSFLKDQSVPVYFFIAGYVFFLGINLNRKTYIRKMKNRFHSLFIPYLLWNSIAILFALFPFLPILHDLFPNVDLNNLHMSIVNVLSCFWEYNGDLVYYPNNPINGQSVYPIDVPMWFVRDLMIVVLFSPIVNYLLKHFNILLPVFAGILWCFGHLFCSGHLYMILTALFFFSFGAYFSFNRRDMITEFKKWRKIAMLSYLMSAIYLFGYSLFSGNIMEVVTNCFWGSEMMFIKKITIVSGLFFAYNLAVTLIEKYKVKTSSTLSSSAFFIYAAHNIIVYYSIKALSFIIPPVNGFLAVLLYLVTTAVICGGLLLLFVLMRRYTPRLLSPFIGGRL